MSLRSSAVLAADGTVFAGRTRIAAIYGVVTTAGIMLLKDGGSSGILIASIPMGVGNIAIEPNNDWRFQTDCYVDFTASLAGSFTFQMP